MARLLEELLCLKLLDFLKQQVLRLKPHSSERRGVFI